MPQPIGKTTWAIPEGYIPKESTGDKPELQSHETVCILNTGDSDAQVEITIFYEEEPPVGPYAVDVPAKRTRHVTFNDLEDPQPIPKATPFASVIESNVPVVCQHTRLDSRQAENALLSTVAFGADS